MICTRINIELTIYNGNIFELFQPCSGERGSGTIWGLFKEGSLWGKKEIDQPDIS